MRSSEFLNEADPANPYTGKDPVKAAAWAKLSPQVQKKLGGADPTDPYIIARMTKGELGGLLGGGVTDANPDGTPKTTAAPAAPAAPAAVPVAAAPVKTAGTGYGDNDTSVFAAPAPTPVANAVAASGEPDNVTGVDAAVAANAAQATTPPAKAPARSTISPAILGYASSMGLYKNGQPDTAAIKAFQQKNGLPADGKIGPNTSGAILSAAKPGDAGSGRGGAGGPTATQMAQNATPPANEKLGPTNTMPRNPMYAPARPSTGYTAQMAWDQQYGKTHSTSGAPKPATPRPSTGYAAQAAWDRQNAAAPANPVRESNFEESVSRMRRLSTLLKG